MNIHPLLKDGDVIASGFLTFDHEDSKSPYYLRYAKNRRRARVLCPRQDVEAMKLLGLIITPHWSEKVNEEGHRAVSNALFMYGTKPVAPHIAAVINGGRLTNQICSHSLTTKEELL